MRWTVPFVTRFFPGDFWEEHFQTPEFSSRLPSLFIPTILGSDVPPQKKMALSLSIYSLVKSLQSPRRIPLQSSESSHFLSELPISFIVGRNYPSFLLSGMSAEQWQQPSSYGALLSCSSWTKTLALLKTCCRRGGQIKRQFEGDWNKRIPAIEWHLMRYLLFSRF